MNFNARCKFSRTRNISIIFCTLILITFISCNAIFSLYNALNIYVLYLFSCCEKHWGPRINVPNCLECTCWDNTAFRKGQKNPLYSKCNENCIHGKLLNATLYKSDLISRYISLSLWMFILITNDGLDYVRLNGWPCKDDLTSVIFNFADPSGRAV